MTLAAARLDARIGLIAVLHTWGQTLTHHPHVHCLVPGGGVALDGRRWVACKPNFLLSVRALSKTFRRLFLEGLEAAFRRGELGFFSELAALADPAAFAERVHAFAKAPSPSTPSRHSVAPSAYWPISPATPTARRSPIRGLSPSTTITSRSPTRTIAAAGAAASCALPRTFSSAAFSSTSCPTGSIASVTTAFSPRATEASPSRVCATCFKSSRQRARRRRARPAGRPRRPRAIHCLPGLRRSHAAHRPGRPHLSLRHIMMASLGSTSIARRQAAKSSALTLLAIAAPLRPVSVANASSPRLEKAAKSPRLRLRTAPRAPRGANSARKTRAMQEFG